MQIQCPDVLLMQPYHVNYKRCGCYIKNPVGQLNVKPQTHVSMPLKHIDYDIEITNGLASITLHQKYYNPTEKFLQIEFSFPIDPKACIYKFVAEFGNKRIEGVVKEKEEAKKEYEQAVKEGKQAVYAQIDPNSKDIMNMEIGNVGPNEQVKISISYLQELNIEQNTFYQFHLASTISPRYMNNVNIKGRRYQENKVLIKGQYSWTFKISILTTHKLAYYMSQSHDLHLISQNQTQTETLLCLPNQQKPNIDLFLIFTVQNFHLPSCVIGRTDVSTSAMLSFIPKFCELSLDDAMKASMIKKQFDVDMSAVKGEYIFLLDRSGSMGGTRIQKAKQALILFLQSLPQDTFFNVISFGSGYNFLENQSIKYNKNNLNKAVQKIKKMSADMGGTQIYNPLQQMLNKKLVQGYPRQIFLLTDGGVSNTEGVIALVGKQTKFSRCHSIGIGNGCSQNLIKGCAEKGKGKYIFIQDQQNPSQKIIGLLQETLTPVIDNIHLKYDKNLVESIVPNPQSIPYILKNQVVNFYISFKGQLQKKTFFTFGYKDSLNKVPYQANLQVDPESINMPFVDKMAHNKIIKNLQNAAKQNKPIQQLMYYVKIVDTKSDAIKQSVKHQILSQYTAFICVNKQLVDGKYQQIKAIGKQKVQIEPMIPNDFYERRERLQNIKLKSANVNGSSMAFSKQSAPLRNAAIKKSSGGLIGSIVSSVSNSFSGLFSNKESQQKPMMAPRMEQQKMMAYDMAPMKQQSRKRSSNLVMKKQKQRCMKQEEEVMDLQMCCDEMISPQIQKKEIKEERKMQKSKDVEVKQRQKTKKESSKSQKISIEDVIKQQNSDGSFTSEKLLKEVLSRYSELKKEAEEKKVSIEVYITYAIAKWIQKNYPQKQYALIIKKALSFIKKTTKLEDLQFLDHFF